MVKAIGAPTFCGEGIAPFSMKSATRWGSKAPLRPASASPPLWIMCTRHLETISLRRVLAEILMEEKVALREAMS